MSAEEAQLNIIREIASTIIHESQHEIERTETGTTNETGPIAQEKLFNNWFNNNINLLKGRIPELFEV